VWWNRVRIGTQEYDVTGWEEIYDVMGYSRVGWDVLNGAQHFWWSHYPSVNRLLSSFLSLT
jgi:alpha/beta superfamily hydrolase